jgi:hypothetical protein
MTVCDILLDEMETEGEINSYIANCCPNHKGCPKEKRGGGLETVKRYNCFI